MDIVVGDIQMALIYYAETWYLEDSFHDLPTKSKFAAHHDFNNSFFLNLQIIQWSALNLVRRTHFHTVTTACNYFLKNYSKKEFFDSDSANFDIYEMYVMIMG